MSPRVSALFFAVCVASAPAWSQATNPSRASTVQELEKKLQLLEMRVNGLQGRVSYRLATLDCNSGKYDEFLLDTGNLTFFAACSKIEPYLEGHRVTISVGNPYAFSFRNIRGKLGYGKDFADALIKATLIKSPGPALAA